MTISYKRTATVEFAMSGTNQTVTVNDLPYVWTPTINPDMDSTAVFAAIDYMRMSLELGCGLSVVCVTTSPA